MLETVVKLNTFRTNDKCFHFTVAPLCSQQPIFQHACKAEPGILGTQSLSVRVVFIFSLLLCQQHLKMQFSASVSLGGALSFPLSTLPVLFDYWPVTLITSKET